MTTPDIQSLVESVMRLDKERTQGEFVIQKYTNYFGWAIYCGVRGCIAERWYDEGQSEEYNAEMHANAQFFALASTALPILARAYNEKDEEIKRLRADNEHLLMEDGLSRFHAQKDEIERLRAELADSHQLQKGIWRTKVEAAESRIAQLEKELAEEKRKVEMATWRPFDPMDPPPIRLSVIVRAKLAGEDVFASHEAFWNGRRMCSVRSDEENYWLKFSEVSHILEMPNCDAALTAPSERKL